MNYTKRKARELSTKLIYVNDLAIHFLEPRPLLLKSMVKMRVTLCSEGISALSPVPLALKSIYLGDYGMLLIRFKSTCTCVAQDRR